MRNIYRDLYPRLPGDLSLASALRAGPPQQSPTAGGPQLSPWPSLPSEAQAVGKWVEERRGDKRDRDRGRRGGDRKAMTGMERNRWGEGGRDRNRNPPTPHQDRMEDSLWTIGLSEPCPRSVKGGTVGAAGWSPGQVRLDPSQPLDLPRAWHLLPSASSVQLFFPNFASSLPCLPFLVEIFASLFLSLCV